MTKAGSLAARTLPPVGSLLLSLLVICLTSTSTQGLRFLGRSDTYARYPKWNPCQNASISFEFKTRQPSALLLYTDDNGRYDFLQLALTKGAVRLWINFVSEENQYVDIEANTEPLNDGQWHRVEIRRNRMETILFVDGSQTSKVALGSDSDFGLDPAQNNYVFFGGVPPSYRTKLRDLALPQAFFNERFRGDVRNILYFNCSCIPVRASMMEGQGVSNAHREACEDRNPCPADCPCVSLDEGSGCECNYKRECLKDILATYELPMDVIDDRALVNPSGLDSIVEGGARLTRGVRDNALQIDGRSQWLRVTGGGHRQECMGDLARCEKGYYMGMWLQFRNAGYQRGVYLSNGGHSSSNHGVALLYAKGRLDVIFKMADGREWRTRSDDVLEGRWYHVAATWSQEKGLYLYINGEKAGHDKTFSKKRAANENSRHNGFYIGRANDQSGLDRLGQVLVDDFMFQSTFKDAKEVRESGPIYHYRIPMDEIRQDRLAGRGLQGRVYGAASQVDGKIKGAILLSGGREYLDFGDVKDTCLSDLDLCQYGVYVSMWVLFNRVDRGSKPLLYSPAVGLHQDGNLLIANAHNLREVWEARYQGLEVGVWYFVELSWKPKEGLTLFVNRQRAGYQSTPTYRQPEAASSMNMYVGRDTSRASRYPAVTVDELEMFYADRTTLTDINFIERERPDNRHFDMDSLARVIRVQGRPEVVEGKVGSAIRLDGDLDALDFGGGSNECFNNLDLCPHGLLVSLWLQPERLQNNAYFLSSGNNGVSVSYRGKKLHVMAATTGRTWEISTSEFDPDKWHFLEVSFHPERGLRLYQNGRLVAESSQSESRTNPAPANNDLDRFYVGRGNADPSTSKHGAGLYDELDVWYADRDYLAAHGFIQRSRPDSVIVHFEESPDQTRVLHPTLDIRLIGRPNLGPGKVGNALELRGRGQYADLGQLSHTCMGNLARCPQGITASAWMKFRRFENNMVFLSTGDNGLVMLYRDGYIQVSADGKGLVTTPRLETDRWYYVEISWHPDHGLKLFVDNELRGESRAYGSTPSPLRDAGHFYVGRPNDGDIPGGRYTTGNFDIDELEVWYGRREDLLAFGYIEREDLGYEAFPMDSAQGDRLSHPRYIVLLKNGARLVQGHVGNALQLNGRGQYLDLGPHLDTCLGNLDKCPHGFTLSVWLKPNTLSDNMHFIAAPSYALFYEDNKLKAEFNSGGRSWLVSTPEFRTGEWQRVTLAWHEKKGLTMYVNDWPVSKSSGVERIQSDQPSSDRVYVGRNLADTRMTADVLTDELKVWYDDLEQLEVTGQYKVEVSPVIITFDGFDRDGYDTIRGRRIRAHGGVRLIPGLTQSSRALYLDGRTQYLDFGENFTCNGNLDTCRQGATLRFALRPDRLDDGAYFVDSFPVKMFYKNGKLHAQMQTSTQVWNVETPQFRQGQWSRVELTWHPTRGLRMFVNGQEVDYMTFPQRRTAVYNDDWRTYLGRPLNDADGSYANTAIDNIEFFNAYRTDVPDDTYRPPPILPPRVTPAPPTRRPFVTNPPIGIGGIGGNTSRGSITIIRFDRPASAMFNFETLSPEYLTRTQEEEFSFWFLSDKPNGLLWYHEEPGRVMYIAMKDGYLMFVNDDKSGRPVQPVYIGRQRGARYNDYNWHKLRIRRNGRHIFLTVDDKDQEEYTFPDDVQFLTPAKVWLGGVFDMYEKTDGNIAEYFDGGMAEVLYVTTNQVGNRLYRNEVNLIAQLPRGSTYGGVRVVTVPNPFPTRFPPTAIVTRPTYPTYPTRPPTVTPVPQPRTTSITVVQRGVVIPLPGFTLGSQDTISFKFKTINKNGLLMFAGDPRGEYMAVELLDGRLYFVHNFGRRGVRTLFSQRVVSDGQTNEVGMRFYNSHIDLRVNDIRTRLDLTSGERLPSNLNTLYLTGYPGYQSLPWMIWARESYLGCLSDLKINSRIIDFERSVQQLFGRVVRRCQAMPQSCAVQNPCQNGDCRNTMSDFLCDCSRTAFRGERCNLDAWAAVFNGSLTAQMDFSQTLESHSDDLSLRFRSPLKDGLLFETFARGSNVFLRCSLEDGKLKVETNLGGELKTMYAGSDLNDMDWHTAYIQRRGNEMEVWVDDQPHTKATLANTGYYLDVDRIFLGGKPGSDDRYIGYLQNFYFGDIDILEEAGKTGLEVQPVVRLPPLIYYPVTFPDLNSFIKLPSPTVPLSSLHFMFKTKEPSGILLFSEGLNRDYLVAELFEGNLHIQINRGDSDQSFRATSEQKVNDDKWHSVTIRRTAGNQRQFLLTVDGIPSSLTYAGRDSLNLQGPLYIGGAPDSLLQRDYVKNGVISRTGFRGCLASIDLSGQVPDLGKFAQQQQVTIHDTCRAIIDTPCKNDTCSNFGTCIERGVGDFTCDCRMSAHSGTICKEEPLGYRYQYHSKPGIQIYTFPQQPTSTRDEIAFGVMTKQDNAVLLRVFSEIVNDHIEFRLNNGYVEVQYDTDSAGGKQTMAQYEQKVNDGRYHIIRFIRTPSEATLFVDKRAGVSNGHTTTHGAFNRMSKIYIGGGYDASGGGGSIQKGFDGIIGGLHINGLLVFPEVKNGLNTFTTGDVIPAPIPFNLTRPGGSVIIITTPPTIPTLPPTVPPVGPGVVPVIPPGIGGGGGAWVPGPAGVDVVLYPGGDAGTGVLVPGPSAVGGGPAQAALLATPPPLPASGPRAGAVVGTILGLMALASSMMWAFYRCKPGWCTCFKPLAEIPMAISQPRAGGTSVSNRGAVLAAGGGVGGAGGAANGAGGGATVSAGSGGVTSSSSFNNFYLSSASAGGGGGGGSGGGAGGGQGGTSIGTPKPVRAHLGSTASGMSGGGYSTGTYRETTTHVQSGGSVTDGGPMSAASLQSYHYEGGVAPGSSTTADYDLATGIHSNYQSNTLTAGGGSISGGSMGGGGGSMGGGGGSMGGGGGSMGGGGSVSGGFSSNTMQSSYNYSVKTFRTVSGQQQMIGYAGANQIGVPPGALGEEVRVDCCLMTNEGRSVVTGSSLGPPQVWDMQSGELLRIMQGETVGSTNLHLACNDRLLVGAINADIEANQSSVPKGVHNYMLQIWDFTTGRALEMADTEVCSALTLMSDNDKVVFAKSDKFGGGTNVVVWDLLGNQPIKHMRYDAPVGNNDYVHYLALSQNDRYVVAGFTNSFDNFAEFVVFDMTLTSYTVSDPSVLRLDANPECTAVLPRDEAVTGLRNGDLVIWSLRTGQPSRQLLSGSGRHAHSREVKAVARSEDSKYLVSASADGTLKIWDVETERHINTLNGHTDEVWCCAISPDNEIVVSGSRDKTIRLWRLKSGSEICSFNAGVDIFHVTMSRDKATIVALGDKLGARKLVMLQVVRTKVRRQVSS